MNETDQAVLEWAADTLVNQRSIVMRIADLVGVGLDRITNVGGRLVTDGLREKLDALIEDAMWRGYSVAIAGLKPEADRQPWAWLHKAMASASGAASGFVGMPGVAIDLPMTTALILRSVAEIARSKGEDIASDDTRRACLEVFAFGGPATEDDEAEKGYWAARLALTFLPTERLVVQAARMFGTAVSQKLMAQAVPGIGALAGGSLNYMFMDYYQQMARVHFSVRDLERRYDAASVRAEFDVLVRQARARRKLGRAKATATG
jgi:hypothetical protein